MPGLIEYIIFTVIGAAIGGGGAYLCDKLDYKNEGIRNLCIGCAVVGGCMAIVGLIAIFCVITSSVVES